MSRVKQLQTQNIWKMLHVNLCRAVKRRRTAMEMFMRRVWHQQCAFCYVHAGRWANVQVCQFAFLFPQRDSFICFRTISLNAHDLHTMLSCLGDVICKERRFDSDSWDWNMEIEKFTLLFVMLFCRYPREHIHTYIHTYIRRLGRHSQEQMNETSFLWMTAAAWQRLLSVCHSRPFALRTSCFLWQKPPTCGTETNSDSTRMESCSPRVRQSSVRFVWITGAWKQG